MHPPGQNGGDAHSCPGLVATLAPAAALTLAASTSPGLVIVDLGDLAQREQQHRRNQADASAGRATPQIAERQTRMREVPEQPQTAACGL